MTRPTCTLLLSVALLCPALSARAQSDPADSLYKVGRNALTAGDYGRAARILSDLVKSYPRSAYAADAPYWEAQARYRIGTTEELRAAAKLLESLVGKPTTTPVAQRGFVGMRRANDGDVATLLARVDGQLAQRGVREAAVKIDSVAQNLSCDSEDMQVKIEAMNGLSQLDIARSTPILRSIVQRRDDCSIPLRRSAVFMLGRRTDTDASALLVSAAKSDPSTSVRSDAIGSLARFPGDAGFNTLEDLLRSDSDERIQRAVVNALVRSDNPKARTSMRALIDRRDSPVALRIEAVNTLRGDRATADDAAYLRTLYGKVESDELKRAIVGAVMRIGGAENEQWALMLARNPNEPSDVRSDVIGRLIRSNIAVSELGKIYDAADSYGVRTQVISVLKNRREPEATDKLIDIVKTGTDMKLKLQAINSLGARTATDPRAQQFLSEFLDGRKPDGSLR